MAITGAQLIVKALKEEGVDLLFAYPGGNILDLFDELNRDGSIEMVLPRHEQGLIHAADGYARATGKVGVCVVTSGPGATNLVTGIATANYDSVPLVCFTGQVPMGLIGNDAFQEIDIVGITRNICKHCITVSRRDKLNKVIKEAFYIARSGHPGPVLIDLPKDVQAALGSEEYPSEVNIRSYKPSAGVHMGQLKKAMDILEKAERPVFLVGGGVNISNACSEMKRLAEATNVPVITTIMGKGAIPTDHELYLGNIGIHGSYASNMAISECDVLFSIGTRFNDRITGNTNKFAQKAAIIHIDIDTASISRNIEVDIPIVANAKTAIEAMLERARPVSKAKGWLEKVKRWKEENPVTMSKSPGMTPEKIICKMNDMFPNAIITTDVGQNQLWTTQYARLNADRRLITSGGLGTMGFGLPSAIGAKLGQPDKDVICVSGDGGMQMNIQELATAVVNELPLVLCVLNNDYLGNVRQLQEVYYGGRYVSTCLRRRRGCPADCAGPNAACPPYTPDFVAIAEAYGAKGIRVTNESEIEAAFNAAKRNTNAPTLIEFIIDTKLNVFPMVPGGKALNEMIMER